MEELRFIILEREREIDGERVTFTIPLTVSSTGRVWGYNTNTKEYHEFCTHHHANPRVVNRRPNATSRYMQVVFCRHYKGRVYYFFYAVHRLVAMAFPDICGVLEAGYDVDHINGICDDNRAVNLRCIPARENRHNAEREKKFRAAMEKHWSDPAYRRKISEARKKSWAARVKS